MDGYPKMAMAFGDLKNAALYFDYLIPVNLGAELIGNQQEWESFMAARGDLVHPSLMQPGAADRLVKVNHATANLVLKHAIVQLGLPPEMKNLSDAQYKAIEETAASEYFRFVHDFGFKDLPVASAGDGPKTAWLQDDPAVDAAPVLTIAKLKLIDVSNASWTQVIEFRRDHEARKRLLRLRLFAFENYSNRPRSYIEDDLEARVAAYEDTARQWGLETVSGALSVVLNSKLTASLVAGNLASSLFGSPFATAVAVGATTLIECGHIAIELTRRRLAVRAMTRDSPVSYVSYARKALGGEAC